MKALGKCNSGKKMNIASLRKKKSFLVKIIQAVGKIAVSAFGFT